MTPVTHPALHRAVAAVLAALMLSGSLVPVAFGASSSATSAAKKPKCAAGKTLVRKKKRVRVTKRVRVHGKMKRKRVWVKKLVWVCGPAAATKTVGDLQAPSAPGGVDAIAGNGQVTLVWNPASDNVAVTGYRVYRDGALVASPGATGHTDAGLTNGRAYTYGVAAVDGAGNVSATATISATPKGAAAKDVTAPTAPPAFTAAPGDRQVALSWGAASDDVGVVFYELRRDGIAIAFQEGRTFTDVQLVNGTTYAYTVLAIDAAGNASSASSVSATPADTVAPSTPGGLAATPGDTQVSLVWNAATDNVGVTGYRVYRDDVLVGSPTTPYFADTGLANGVQHTYKVVAVDVSGNASASSSPVSATPTAPVVSDQTPPSVPTSLAGTAGTNQVSLTWTASTDNVGVTGYKVYRGGQLVGSPAGPSFTDTGLTNGTQYTYTVAAVDANGNTSAASSPVNVTPRDTLAPSIPGGITLTKNNQQHSITVAWTASTDNVGVLRYRVYRKTNSGAYVLVSQPTGTSYSDLDLANGKTYTYTVEAVDAAGNVSAQAPAVSTYVS
jgi:chitodextrinase